MNKHKYILSFDDVIGKTIEKIVDKSIKDAGIEDEVQEYDDTLLEIKFTDGTSIVLEGVFYGYTGHSRNEYPTGVALFGYEIDNEYELEDFY